MQVLGENERQRRGVILKKGGKRNEKVSTWSARCWLLIFSRQNVIGQGMKYAGGMCGEWK